ncbi:MAG: ABC transporter ATP-binding protein [Deltaproteobacteria bacterium]|nr:ABC transporter ATP-binding protein [Deltaproteobacteria bacterium]
MIQLLNLTKYYGTGKALQDLSFSVAPGEIVGLVGKNGAGKSTALKIISCQLLPSEGDVRVDGLSVVESPLEVRHLIGYLPEQPPLYPEMTVTAYLDFTARLRGLTASQAQNRREIVMGETGLSDVCDERLGNLSRGYQQRVGIAQAIIHQPRVVLLDEPMAGLDPFQIVQIRELIRSLRNRHTVLFSSHILAEITNVCDRVVLIDRGALKAQGTEGDLHETLAGQQRLFLQVRGGENKLKAVLDKLPETRFSDLESRNGEVVQVHITARGDVREILSRACHEAGLGVMELRTEKHGLEDLFMELLGKAEVA